MKFSSGSNTIVGTPVDKCKPYGFSSSVIDGSSVAADVSVACSILPAVIVLISSELIKLEFSISIF